MKIDKFFQIISYTAVFLGFLSLWISGTFGLVGGLLFAGLMTGAWFLEGSRWQITERPGTALIVLAIPVYYALWWSGIFELAGAVAALPGFLARLILTLTAIKLLQNKSDRDWIFLYLMSFFQILLAAGLSISALYLAVFVGYVFAIVCSVILLEIRRTRKQISKESEGLIATDEPPVVSSFIYRKVPLTAFGILLLTALIAAPIFFMLPRVGAAGAGGTAFGGVKTYSGFSDSVRLGQIGIIQESDEVVMRVRLDIKSIDQSAIRWRGVALDTFDNKSWTKSATGLDGRAKGERDAIQVDYAMERAKLVRQTFYLEPLDSPVLFGLPRPVIVQGNFPVIFQDKFKSLSIRRSSERTSYRIHSDTALPGPAELRADRMQYGRDDTNYLQLPPDLDIRISDLAEEITKNISNRHDAAMAVESYLQTSFSYTLEQKAGGSQPLADFLFNVREGHCEYFSTAMAVMLRTQGIATRVVNGFQRGEYNETADVFVVRQKNAHSWVEVYFPGENAWVTFDPTPFAGRESTAGAANITGKLNHYLQALEAFWIEYFVAYDNQEQRSMFSSVKRGFRDFQRRSATVFESLSTQVHSWWSEIRGDAGFKTSVFAVAQLVVSLLSISVFLILIVWARRKVVKSTLWLRLRERFSRRPRTSIVGFYDRMLQALASKGIVRESHQTPFEFAFALSTPEVIHITEKYNDVRFGGKQLTTSETREIEDWLENLVKPMDE